ncbi:MAG TPA: MarR family transcriptional regulator [Anaerolineales bacterium]|nr:MarR family transcriptional regulator [Anaerolineales bacterium]
MTEPRQLSQSLRQWMDVTSHRSMQDQTRFVKSIGFSMAQFFLLMHVYYKRQCGISNLSEHMEITAPAASQLVDKLVQAGMLERAEDPHDRRAKQVTLTHKGRQLIEKSIHERFRWLESLVQGLSAAERSTVSEALRILTSAAEEREKKVDK